MKKVILIIVVGLCVLTSCKKDSSNPNASLIIGKWYVAKVVQWQTNTSTNVITKDSTFYNDGSYSDIRSDNKIYEFTNSNNNRDTLAYSVSGNNLIINFIGATSNFYIQNLDTHNLQTYVSQISGSIKSETWDYFYR